MPTIERVVLSDDYYGYRFPVPSEFTLDLFASNDDKWTVLESVGIARRDDATPLVAWRDAVADESGIPRAELDPAAGGYLDLGFTPAHIRQFVLYLA